MIHPLQSAPTVESLRDVLPSPASTSPASSLDVIVYELKPRRPLPAIDCSKTLKYVVLPSKWVSRFNAFQFVAKKRTGVAFAVGLVLACIGPVVDKRVGEVAAIVSTILLVVPLVMSTMELRVDILAMLTTTFEFWYFTLVSLCCNALLGVNIGDWRALSTACETVMYQLTLVIDAKSQGVRRTIIASVMGAVTLLCFVVLQQLALVQDYKTLRIASRRTWSLETSDVIASGLSNVAAVLLRNAYRKWRAMAALNQNHATVEFITYNTHLRLVEISPSQRQRSTRASRASRVPAQSTSLSLTHLPSTVQLRLVRLPLQIKADDFVQPRALKIK